MVMAKLNRTKNCYLLSRKGCLELAFVFNLSMSKNAIFPVLFRDTIFTSNILMNNPQHNNRELLHMLYLGSMFHNNIKIHAFLC